MEGRDASSTLFCVNIRTCSTHFCTNSIQYALPSVSPVLSIIGVSVLKIVWWIQKEVVHLFLHDLFLPEKIRWVSWLGKSVNELQLKIRIVKEQALDQ